MSAVSEWVRQMYPYAHQVYRKTGIYPEVVLAHWGLETGWGKDPQARSWSVGLNPAGIKATKSWKGQTVGPYRAYSSLEQAVQDYINVIMSPLYYKVRQARDPVAQAQALGASPWATDPAYGYKLTQSLLAVQSVSKTATVPEKAAAVPFYPFERKWLTPERYGESGEKSVWESLGEEERKMVERESVDPSRLGWGLDRIVNPILRWGLIIAAAAGALYSLARAYEPEVKWGKEMVKEVATTVAAVRKGVKKRG